MSLGNWLIGVRHGLFNAHRERSRRLPRMRRDEHFSSSIPAMIQVLEQRALLSTVSAVDDFASGSHDQVIVSSVLDNDSCFDDFAVSQPMTASVADGPSNGTLDFNADGTFTYTPDAGFVGNDSFTYTASGAGTSDDATVELEITNYAPWAGDDEYNIDPDLDPQPIALDVLWNDSDWEGDDLTIVSVSSSQLGATITIDVSGDFLWYTPPPPEFTDIAMGGSLDLSEDIPEDTGGVEDITDEGGFSSESDFLDSFQYTIADTVGATAVANVQVVNQQMPA